MVPNAQPLEFALMAHNPAYTASLLSVLRDLTSTQPVRIRVRGHCMEPLVADGAWVRVDKAAPLYWPGDVVVVATGGRLALHRVIGGYRRRGRWRWLTQGDAAVRPDAATTREAILGKVAGGDCAPCLIHVPLRHRLRALGRFLAFCARRPARTPSA